MKFTLALVAAAFLGGCASSAKLHEAEIPGPRAVAVFRGDGRAAGWDEMIAEARAADVILVGENHGHPLGLASASAIWEDVLSASPKGTLAMEFFERDEQTALDDYFAGITDEEAFRKAAHRSDGNYPPGHRAMVEATRAKSRPVVAANAPRRYVRIARTDGYDRLKGLGQEQTRLFRVPDQLPTGPYREAFNKVMSPPAEGSKSGTHGAAGPVDPAKEATRLDAAFRSQSLWDWTMADSVNRALEGGGRPVMLVVGRFHVDNEGGTLLALRSMHPGVRTVTVSFVNEWGTGLGEDDKGRADFVVYVGPSEEE